MVRILERPNNEGNSSTQPYFLKCKKVLETEDLLILSWFPIVLHDRPSKELSTISHRRCSFRIVFGMTRKE